MHLDGDDMKKIGLFVLIGIGIILLAGCQKTVVDYEAIYEEYYADAEYVPSEEFDLCDNVIGDSSNIEIDYINPFDDLEDMMESEYSYFVYGEIY
jgi:hypothetical protein